MVTKLIKIAVFLSYFANASYIEDNWINPFDGGLGNLKSAEDLEKKEKEQQLLDDQNNANSKVLLVNLQNDVQESLQKAKVQEDNQEIKNTGMNKAVETIQNTTYLKDILVRFINLVQNNSQPGNECVLLLRISVPQLNRLQEFKMNNSNESEVVDVLNEILKQLELCVTKHSFKEMFSNIILPAVLLIVVLGLTCFWYNKSMFDRNVKKEMHRDDGGVKVAEENDWQ